jgi:hypothetical protein
MEQGKILVRIERKQTKPPRILTVTDDVNANLSMIRKILLSLWNFSKKVHMTITYCAGTEGIEVHEKTFGWISRDAVPFKVGLLILVFHYPNACEPWWQPDICLAVESPLYRVGLKGMALEGQEGWHQIDQRGVAPADCSNQRKDIYIEHRAGKVPAWLAAGKWPSRVSFVGDGSCRGCPVCEHLPPFSWVHLHSIYSHELNHAQQAGADAPWLKLRWIGTQIVQIKGVPPWLDFWACCSCTREFWSALAALVVPTKFFFLLHPTLFNYLFPVA